ncbi:TPA: hypothetical protein RTG57_001719 [Campylobacter jejuni]|nr:hypothetical protein [Campylobacter jejuni]HDZ5057791.1 hypothetical protein [Campylobacter jejuni]
MVRIIILVLLFSGAFSLFWYIRALNEQINGLEIANSVANNEITKLKNIIDEQNNHISSLKADVKKANNLLNNNNFHDKYKITDLNISKCEDILKFKLRKYFEKSSIFNN